MTPLVSIIIPLYNHEQFIVKCLDSVRDDSYPNKEIVIIDDGSKDASVEMVRQWQAANAGIPNCSFTFLARENRGLTKTLNELVGLSNGDLVAVLASDDYLLPGSIETRAKYLERHEDKLAVFADCILVDYNNKISYKSGLSDLHEGIKSHLNHPRLLSYELVFNWCVPGPVFMARKKTYALIGGYNENIVVEDWDFYLRLAAPNLIGFIDSPVAAYRIRPDEPGKTSTNEQHARFNQAMLQTVSTNISSFTGIKKAYLFAQRLKFYGILERCHGSRSLEAFLARKAGRIMETLLKCLYKIWARSIVLTSR